MFVCHMNSCVDDGGMSEGAERTVTSRDRDDRERVDLESTK